MNSTYDNLKKKKSYAFLMLLHKQESEEANGNKQTPHTKKQNTKIPP